MFRAVPYSSFVSISETDCSLDAIFPVLVFSHTVFVSTCHLCRHSACDKYCYRSVSSSVFCSCYVTRCVSCICCSVACLCCEAIYYSTLMYPMATAQCILFIPWVPLIAPMYLCQFVALLQICCFCECDFVWCFFFIVSRDGEVLMVRQRIKLIKLPVHLQRHASIALCIWYEKVLRRRVCKQIGSQWSLSA